MRIFLSHTAFLTAIEEFLLIRFAQIFREYAKTTF